MLLALLLIQTPTRHHITSATIPAPYATQSVDNGPRVQPRNGAPLYVAPGFKVEAWATGLSRPRRMAVAPNGDVFVSESFNGRVILLRQTKAGEPQKYVFATGLRQPYGIAFYPPGPNPKYIYIGHTDALVRYPYKVGQVAIQGAGQKLFDLPGGGYNQHWTRNVAVRPDGKKIYVTVGSATNASPEEAPRASITEANPDGTARRIYANGLRNPVGLAFNPKTGALWTAVNERDRLGNDLVPDYATSVKDGGFYGWPYYFIGNHHDPRLPEKPELGKKAIVPDALLESHCAALGIVFPGTGSKFKSDAYVSMHGSWNRTPRSGYKVVRLPMNASGKATGEYVDFVWGWNQNGRVWGRPVDVQFDKSGALLISDDDGGTIWRVTPR